MRSVLDLRVCPRRIAAIASAILAAGCQTINIVGNNNVVTQTMEVQRTVTTSYGSVIAGAPPSSSYSIAPQTKTEPGSADSQGRATLLADASSGHETTRSVSYLRMQIKDCFANVPSFLLVPEKGFISDRNDLRGPHSRVPDILTVELDGRRQHIVNSGLTWTLERYTDPGELDEFLVATHHLYVERPGCANFETTFNLGRGEQAEAKMSLSTYEKLNGLWAPSFVGPKVGFVAGHIDSGSSFRESGRSVTLASDATLYGADLEIATSFSLFGGEVGFRVLTGEASGTDNKGAKLRTPLTFWQVSYAPLVHVPLGVIAPFVGFKVGAAEFGASQIELPRSGLEFAYGAYTGVDLPLWCGAGVRLEVGTEAYGAPSDGVPGMVHADIGLVPFSPFLKWTSTSREDENDAYGCSTFSVSRRN